MNLRVSVNLSKQAQDVCVCAHSVVHYEAVNNWDDEKRHLSISFYPADDDNNNVFWSSGVL